MRTLPDMGAWELTARGINLEGWLLVREALKSDWAQAVNRFGLTPRFATRISSGTLQDMQVLAQNARLGLVLRDPLPGIRTAASSVSNNAWSPPSEDDGTDEARFHRFNLLYLLTVQNWSQQDPFIASAMAVLPIEAVELLAEMSVQSVLSLAHSSTLRYSLRHAAGLELLSVTIYNAKFEEGRVQTAHTMALFESASREWH